MKRLLFALLLWGLLLQPQPPRQPMVPCDACGTLNDPARGSTQCRNCKAPI